MSKALIAACLVLTVVTSVAHGSVPAPAQSPSDKVIAAEILRLGDPNADVQTAAKAALLKIAKPAVPQLIKTLADPRETVRARAADVLRPLLAADPTSDPISTMRPIGGNSSHAYPIESV